MRVLLLLLLLLYVCIYVYGIVVYNWFFIIYAVIESLDRPHRVPRARLPHHRVRRAQ